MAAKFITVQDLRKQLVLLPDEGDDTHLALLCSAAEISIIDSLNRNVYDTGETIPETDTTGMFINDSLKLGMLMMAATLDQSREFNSEGIIVYRVPNTSDMLVKIYRVHAI